MVFGTVDPVTSRRQLSFRRRDPDLNWGHMDFQSIALPTELSRQKDRLARGLNRAATNMPDFSGSTFFKAGPYRAGDEIRTHDLLLGKETFYH